MGGFFDYGVVDDRGVAATSAERFLERATETDWSTLLAYAERRQLSADEILFEQGDTSRALMIVLKGTFQASVPGRRRGHQTVTGTITTGSVLGELAFFDGAPRSARITATEPSEVLILEWIAFEKLAVARPALAVDVLSGLGQILAARFRAASVNNG